MTKRINVILPEETIKVLNRVASKGNRSRLIDQAVLFYLKAKSRENLRQRLKEGYMASAQENLKLAQEWFPVEEEAWQKAKRKKSQE
jgi:CopG family transcriptional regulator/antitoxin EndoAI